jgi:hypothetical protein
MEEPTASSKRSTLFDMLVCSVRKTLSVNEIPFVHTSTDLGAVFHTIFLKKPVDVTISFAGFPGNYLINLKIGEKFSILFKYSDLEHFDQKSFCDYLFEALCLSVPETKEEPVKKRKCSEDSDEDSDEDD